MRILHVDLGREMRGGQRQAILLMKGLRDRGHLGELLARPASPLWEEAQRAGFEVATAACKELFRRSPDADIVHAHDARAHTLAAFAASAKLVVSRRVAFPLGAGFWSRWKYRRAKRFLAVSAFVGEQLRRAGIEPERIDLVYDGVAMRTLERATSADAPLVALASRDLAKGRDLLERCAAESGFAISFSSNLERDLPGAAAFLYITHSEGLGSAALLAMSLGVPVIASNLGGLPEIVRHRETGLLVENNSSAIAAAVFELRNDPALARSLATGARLLVEKEFTVERMVDRTLESYARALTA